MTNEVRRDMSGKGNRKGKTEKVVISRRKLVMGMMFILIAGILIGMAM